jgi:hypothetical protein
MRADVQRVSSFAEVRSFLGRPVYKNRYRQFNPLAPPLLQPSFLAGRLGHTRSRYARSSPSSRQKGVAVPIKQIGTMRAHKQFFREICARDLEGIVGKRKNGLYRDDRSDWVKVKNRSYSQAEGGHKLQLSQRSN